MPATINGSPTHVLIVHIIVVLLPVSILAALALVFIPRTRKAFGLVSVLVAFVACIAIPFAFMTGGKLRGLVPPSPLINHHVDMAHQLAIVAAAFGVMLVAFVGIDLRRRAQFGELNQVEDLVVRRLFVGWTRPRHTYRAATRVAAGLLVVLAALTTVAVVRTGDSGAKAAWSERLAAQPQQHK